jgi:hypothetical protein
VTPSPQNQKYGPSLVQVPWTEVVPCLFDRSALGKDAPEAGEACRRVASWRWVSFRSVIATMGC